MHFEMKKELKDKIEILKMQNQDDCILHEHNFIELVYITGGEGFQELAGKKEPVKKGNFFIIDYKTSHNYFKNENLSLTNCLFLPEIIHFSFHGIQSFNELCRRYFLSVCGETVKAPVSNKIMCDKTGELGLLFEKMDAEFSAKRQGYREKLRCYLCEVLIEMIRLVGSEEKCSAITKAVMQKIEQNFEQPLTLQDFCLEFHYSLPYISSRFHRETGFTFSEYLQKCRIEAACQLLCSDEKSVAEIAEEVGYKDLKFFHAVFKKITGLTPSLYKKYYCSF